ncbi:DUF7079 family protein [Pseudomonas fluorescens]|uniref:DUF7079 family protein n=1 Tax=Pseudomonas fluorescens TaxID=294 RepID=UPI003F99EF40
MERTLTSRELWVALSDLFVDTDVDYKRIARVISGCSIEEVEFALFQRVAPVCVANMLTPAPPVWWYFDEGKLIEEIEALIKRRSNMGLIGKVGAFVNGRLTRIVCYKVWSSLRLEMVSAGRKQ